MSILLSDLLTAVDDATGNYATGVIDTEVKKRAINRAIEFLKRKIGFPSDEKIQSFYFSEDQLYYDCAVDFDEGIWLGYNDQRLNTPSAMWEYEMYPDILRRTGSGLTKQRFSFTTINGSNQVMMLGSNIAKGSTLDALDDATEWVVTGDASNLEQETFQTYDGNTALRFDITNSTGVAGIERDDFSLDLEELFQKHGRIKFWNYMTDNDIDDVTIYLKTDDSNYYTITEDDQDDGTAFAQDEWTKIGFSVDDAVSVGTPDSTGITEIRLEYDLGAGFTSAADFRVDKLFTSFPDKMDLIYYSRYKGTDTTGVTSRTDLTTTTDIASFGITSPDMLDLVARKAALTLMPSLRGDKEFYSAYVADLNDWIKTWTRAYPRKRLQGSQRHYLRR